MQWLRLRRFPFLFSFCIKEIVPYFPARHVMGISSFSQVGTLDSYLMHCYNWIVFLKKKKKNRKMTPACSLVFYSCSLSLQSALKNRVMFTAVPAGSSKLPVNNSKAWKTQGRSILTSVQGWWASKRNGLFLNLNSEYLSKFDKHILKMAVEMVLNSVMK